MGAMTGVLAGMATIIGAAALLRMASRRAAGLKAALDEAQAESRGSGSVLDYERDPETGVFRPKA